MFTNKGKKQLLFMNEAMRSWRNGRRESFKSFSPFGGVGSSPIARIFFIKLFLFIENS